MVERRSLIEGLNQPLTDVVAAEEFLSGDKAPRKPKQPVKPIQVVTEVPIPTKPTNVAIVEGRVLVSARIRVELASRLKRMSLERQLAAIEPNRLQDIIEVALEEWFAKQSESVR
jgi:hypothetical protein